MLNSCKYNILLAKFICITLHIANIRLIKSNIGITN